MVRVLSLLVVIACKLVVFAGHPERDGQECAHAHITTIARARVKVCRRRGGRGPRSPQPSSGLTLAFQRLVTVKMPRARYENVSEKRRRENRRHSGKSRCGTAAAAAARVGDGIFGHFFSPFVRSPPPFARLQPVRAIGSCHRGRVRVYRSSSSRRTKRDGPRERVIEECFRSM